MLAGGMDTAAAESVRVRGRHPHARRRRRRRRSRGSPRSASSILPHPEVLEYFRRKASDYDRWLAGMRRLRRAVDPPARDERPTGGPDVRAEEHL